MGDVRIFEANPFYLGSRAIGPKDIIENEEESVTPFLTKSLDFLRS